MLFNFMTKDECQNLEFLHKQNEFLDNNIELYMNELNKGRKETSYRYLYKPYEGTDPLTDFSIIKLQHIKELKDAIWKDEKVDTIVNQSRGAIQERIREFKETNIDDPMVIFGHGIQTYFGLIYALIGMLFLIIILLSPVMVIYY
jgi:hypothetical protein